MYKALLLAVTLLLGACSTEEGAATCGGGSGPQTACEPDLDQEACAAEGGTWNCGRLDPSVCWCACRTNDAGCPCDDSSDCEGACLSDSCSPGEVEGHCTAFTQLQGVDDCLCLVSEGTGQQLCP